jgi:hypothetical protein
MEPIASVLVGAGGSNSIVFNDIPQTYKHLQLRFIGRSTRSSVGEDTVMRFNSDAGDSYSWHYLFADGANAYSAGAANQTSIIIPTVAAANATSGIYGASIVDILDYTNTNKFKTARSLGGNERNGSGDINLESGMWRNTQSVVSITVLTTLSNSFVQHSRFSLYGIKG